MNLIFYVKKIHYYFIIINLFLSYKLGVRNVFFNYKTLNYIVY